MINDYSSKMVKTQDTSINSGDRTVPSAVVIIARFGYFVTAVSFKTKRNLQQPCGKNAVNKKTRGMSRHRFLTGRPTRFF